MKLFAIFALALAAVAVHAQAPDEAAERARIRQEQEAADKRFKEAEKTCRAKFAVNDCIAEARRERNAVVTELKRQERILNDEERTRKAAQRQKEIDERSSPERQQEAARKRAKAAEEQEERDARAAEKAAKHAADEAEHAKRAPRVKTPKGDTGPQGSPREPKAAKSHGLSPEEAAKNKAEHEQRVQDAERHKAEVAARNAKRTKPASADLPPPARAASGS
jgi:colicin import membrane protein